MKTTAILALLLFASCATRDGFVDEGMRQCNPGDPLEINAGFTEQAAAHTGQINLTVEVQNNSDRDVTVQSVRVIPNLRGDRTIDVQGGSREFGTEVVEGEAETFEVPMTIRLRDGMMPTPSQRGITYRVDASIVVQLEGGESYRCSFRLPVPL